MFTLYGGDITTWAEMTSEERKIFLIIIIGIMVFGISLLWNLLLF